MALFYEEEAAFDVEFDAKEVAEAVINIKNLSSGEQKSFAKDDVDGMMAFMA